MKEKNQEKLTWEQNVSLYLHDCVYMLSAILIVFMLLFRVIVVSGPSMNQTLLNGDLLLLLSNSVYHNPRPGDVVVAAKSSFDNGKPIVKRVIALEGQTVDINFQEGLVYVDGVLLQEDYVNTPTNLWEGEVFPVTVQPGCVFVMGDNRNNSKDSRSLEIGQIDKRELMGKALFIFLPAGNSGGFDFGRMGVVK